MKVSTGSADGPVMVVLQPIVIALNIVLLIWAFRVLDTIEQSDA